MSYPPQQPADGGQAHNQEPPANNGDHVHHPNADNASAPAAPFGEPQPPGVPGGDAGQGGQNPYAAYQPPAPHQQPYGDPNQAPYGQQQPQYADPQHGGHPQQPYGHPQQAGYAQNPYGDPRQAGYQQNPHGEQPPGGAYGQPSEPQFSPPPEGAAPASAPPWAPEQFGSHPVSAQPASGSPFGTVPFAPTSSPGGAEGAPPGVPASPFATGPAPAPPNTDQFGPPGGQVALQPVSSSGGGAWGQNTNQLPRKKKQSKGFPMWGFVAGAVVFALVLAAGTWLMLSSEGGGETPGPPDPPAVEATDYVAHEETSDLGFVLTDTHEWTDGAPEGLDFFSDIDGLQLGDDAKGALSLGTIDSSQVEYTGSDDIEVATANLAEQFNEAVLGGAAEDLEGENFRVDGRLGHMVEYTVAGEDTEYSVTVSMVEIAGDTAAGYIGYVPADDEDLVAAKDSASMSLTFGV